MTAIEEVKDKTSMKLEELMGFLRTFAMNFEEKRSEKKANGIVLKADTERDDPDSRYDDEDLVKSFEMLSKNMRHAMKKMNMRSSIGVPHSVPSPS